MKVRNALGLAVTVPALVATFVQPANAASQAVVSYTGTFQMTPTSAGVAQVTRFCFSAVAPCPDEVAPTGVAGGPAVGLPPESPKVIDGLYVVAEYTENCTAGTGIPAIGSANLVIQVHDALSGTWSPSVPAEWVRVGPAALIRGSGIVSAATFTPVGVPVCDAPLTIAVSGDGLFTY